MKHGSRRGTGVYGPTLMQNGGVILNFFFKEKCAEGNPPAHPIDIYLQYKLEDIANRKLHCIGVDLYNIHNLLHIEADFCFELA